MKKKLPIGLSDFKRLIEDDYYFVDKSLLIKEVIDSGSQVLLLTRPRRFGKTLNLTMLRNFFEKTRTSNKHLFASLAIWKCGKTYHLRQGIFPVIYITFKDLKKNTWDDCLLGLRRIIAEECSRLLRDTTSDSLGMR